MKSYLKTLLALLLVVVCVFAYTACGGTGAGTGGGSGEGSGEGSGSGETPGPDTGDVPTDEELWPDEEEATYLLEFVYRYSILTQNSNGRNEKKDTVQAVRTFEIPVSNTGLTDEIKAEIAALTYNGYSFESWYTQYDATAADPGVVGDPFDFNTLGKIEGDMTFYGFRGELAGADITWAVETVQEGRKSVTTLTLTGTGAMFDFANANNIDLPWGSFAADVDIIVLSEGITAIGANAFANFTSLTEVVFPSTLESIGEYSFMGCAKYKTLVTPANLKTIGKNAYNNTGLTSVVLNEGLTDIMDAAFAGSRKIKSIVIPSTVTYIGGSAFHPGEGATHSLSKVYSLGTAEQFAEINIGLDNAYLTDLASIYFYNADSTALGPYWHYATDAEGNATDIPVQNCFIISYYLGSQFGIKTPIWYDYVAVTPKLDENGAIIYDDDNLPILEGTITQDNVDFGKGRKYHGYEFVKFNATNPTGVDMSKPGSVVTSDVKVTCINYTASGATGYEGYLSDDGGIKWKFNPVNGTLYIYKDSTVVDIEGDDREPYRIWDFKSSDDTTCLWTAANASSVKVTSIEIGDGVEYLGRLTFANMSNVTTVHIPASVKEIHKNAFSGCTNLVAIYYEGADLTECAIVGAAEGKTLADRDSDSYVTRAGNPAAAYAKTVAATDELGAYWLDMGTHRIGWILEEVEGGYKITVGGDANIIDFDDTNVQPWAGAKDQIVEAAFENNILTIGENVFKGCANLAKVSIPNKVTVIPATAFEGTALVANTDAYENGLLIVDKCLIKTEELDFIELPRGTTTVAGGAFDNCTEIGAIYVPSSVKYIHPQAFASIAPSIIYYDESEAAWAGVSADLDFAKAPHIAFKLDPVPEDESLIPDGSWWYVEDGMYVTVGCAHNWTEWDIITPATCTTAGLRTHTCLGECKETREEVIPAFGHDWSDWIVDPADTTKEIRTCKNEGCTAKEQRDIVIEGQLGFSYDFNSDTLASLKADGKIDTKLAEGTYDPTGAGFATVATDSTNGNKYLNFGRGSGGGSEAAVVLMGTTNASLVKASKIVVSFDMNILSELLGPDSANADDDGQWNIRIRLGGSSDQTARSFLIIKDYKGDAENLTFMTPNKNVLFKANEWHNFRIVYDTTTGLSELYLNGEFVEGLKPHASYKDGPVTDISSVQIHTRGQTYYANGVSIGIDNFSITPWDENSLGSVYDFENVSSFAGYVADGSVSSVAQVTPDTKFDAAGKGYATVVTDATDGNKYMEFGRGSAGGEAKFRLNNMLESKYAMDSDYMVAQFKLRIPEALVHKNNSNSWPIRIRLGGTSDSTSWANILLKTDGKSTKMALETNVKSETTVTTVDFAEWVEITVIYDTNEKDSTKRSSIYFNGVFAGHTYHYPSYTEIPTDPGFICVETRGNSHYNTVRYHVDDIRFATLSKDNLNLFFTEVIPEEDDDTPVIEEPTDPNVVTFDAATTLVTFSEAEAAQVVESKTDANGKKLTNVFFAAKAATSSRYVSFLPTYVEKGADKIVITFDYLQDENIGDWLSGFGPSGDFPSPFASVNVWHKIRIEYWIKEGVGNLVMMVDGSTIYTKTGTANAIADINEIQFHTFGKTDGNMYFDNVSYMKFDTDGIKADIVVDPDAAGKGTNVANAQKYDVAIDTLVGTFIDTSIKDKFVFGETSTEKAYATIVTVEENKVLQFAKTAKNMDPYLYFNYDKTAEGNGFVFETDFYLTSATDVRANDDVVLECINGRNEGDASNLTHVWLGQWSISQTAGVYYLNAANETVAIKAGGWYNLKIEICQSADDGIAQTRFYLNGTLISIKVDTITAVQDMSTMRLRWKYEVTDGSINFDNTYAAKTTLTLIESEN